MTNDEEGADGPFLFCTVRGGGGNRIVFPGGCPVCGDGTIGFGSGMTTSVEALSSISRLGGVRTCVCLSLG